MLQTLRQDYQMNLETKQQVLTIDDTQEKVLADPAALWQVLDNLLSNACKYTPHHGQIFIHIRSEVNQIRIEIEDQGPGIAKHELDRLFQKFSKLSAKPTGNEHSTGLGLFIVKHLLGLMQGKVVCESQFGYGAKFIVYLPAATEVTQA
jgi:signal transduction histidine kinase